MTMRGAVLHGPRDVRFEERDAPAIVHPTDAVIRLAATCIGGSDLWPYRGISPTAEPTPLLRVPLADGTLVATADVPARDMIPSLLALSDVMGTGWFAAEAQALPTLIDLVFGGTIDPGKVFDLTLPLDQVAEGYGAMDERRAIKTLLRP
jgi:threonine dehydrogenase-like Zn-dependent dehydrogenase